MPPPKISFHQAIHNALNILRRKHPGFRFVLRDGTRKASATIDVQRLRDGQCGEIVVNGNLDPEKIGAVTSITPFDFPHFEHVVSRSLAKSREFHDAKSTASIAESLKGHGSIFMSGSGKKTGSHGQDKHK